MFGRRRSERERRNAGEPGAARRSVVAPDTVQLVGLGRAGDRAALNEFLRRYLPRLERVVRIRMGPLLRRHVDPDDIVQETLIVAVEKLPTFRAEPGSSVLCWLTKIADHVASNKRGSVLAQKRDPRRERRLSAAPDEAGLDLEARQATPSQVVSRREIEARVDACVEELEPEPYRQVILLRDYCDAGWEAIRAELDRPTVDSARELHRRARLKLREKLAQRGLD